MAAAAGAAPALVTLNVGDYRNANGIRVLVFAGTVSSTGVGEAVDILGKDCGVEGFRSFSGTQTLAGGTFRVENPESMPPYRSTPWQSGITFRARAKGELSAEVPYRLPAPLSLRKVGRRAWRVSVSPPHPGTVRMRGKPVELQRRVRGTWRTIQRKPLVYKPRLVFGGAFNHEVVFKVQQRGWVLRAVLPVKSALPCYLAAATAEWRS